MQPELTQDPCANPCYVRPLAAKLVNQSQPRRPGCVQLENLLYPPGTRAQFSHGQSLYVQCATAVFDVAADVHTLSSANVGSHWLFPRIHSRFIFDVSSSFNAKRMGE